MYFSLLYKIGCFLGYRPVTIQLSLAGLKEVDASKAIDQ